MEARNMEFGTLLGETLVKVIGAKAGSEEVLLRTASGRQFTMYHQQECCESVTVEDVAGDVADLIGSPLVQAECVSNSDDPPPAGGFPSDSYTWTFYKLGTAKGFVTIRWYGESNSYYGEKVYFVEMVR